MSELQKDPVPIFITAGASVLSAVNGFIGTLGVSPFWADSIVGTLLCVVLAFWVYRVTKQVASNRRSRGKLASFKALTSGVGASLGIIIVVLALSVWTWIGPVRQIVNPQWSFCGRVVTSCQARSCLLLFDWRGRKIKDECYLPSDDSGYFDISASQWWMYKPFSFAVSCGDKLSQPHSTSPMFKKLCDGLLDLR